MKLDRNTEPSRDKFPLVISKRPNSRVNASGVAYTAAKLNANRKALK